MSSQEKANKELVREYLNAFNERDAEAITDYLADDVVEHGFSEEHEGIDAIMGFLDTHFDIFPDYTGETEAILAEDELVVVRYTVSGTHTGEYHDVEPTGYKVDWTGFAMYRIEDGQIAEIWLEEDRLGLLEQLEYVDPPAHLRL